MKKNNGMACTRLRSKVSLTILRLPCENLIRQRGCTGCYVLKSKSFGRFCCVIAPLGVQLLPYAWFRKPLINFQENRSPSSKIFMCYGLPNPRDTLSVRLLFSLHRSITVNFLNIRTPKKFVVITLKFELCCSTIE